MERVLRSPALENTNVGVKAVDLSTGRTVFAKNSAKLFIPASNVKLITAYAALKLLSPRYVFSTEFLTDNLVNTSVAHDLYVRGRGDPTVTLADMNMQAFSLSEKISAVTGDVIVDNSWFDGLPFGKGWMWDDVLEPWNAPISPYAVNGNCVDIIVTPGPGKGKNVSANVIPRSAYAVVVASAVTSDTDDLTVRREETPSGDRFIVEGSISASSPGKRVRCAVSRPALYAGTLFKELLVRYGVKVTGGVYERPVPTGTAVLIERFSSRELAEIVRAFLKDSDNLAGECILKTLGATASGGPGSAEKGIAAVKAELGPLGIAETAYSLADGSGLSVYNRLSPDSIITVLRAGYADFSLFPEFLDALSIGGVDGTLKGRGRLAGFVRAKTGTMSGVSCISGYLRTRGGNLLAVSVMMNGNAGAPGPLADAQDELLYTLWENY